MEPDDILDLEDAKKKMAAADASTLKAVALKAGKAVHVLEGLVEKHSHYRPTQPQVMDDGSVDDGGVGKRLKVSEIISGARRISHNTFAPPEFAQGRAPLRRDLLPAPQEEHMHASQLHAYANLDVGLPEPVRNIEPLIVLSDDDGTPVEAFRNVAPDSIQEISAAVEEVPPDFSVPPGEWEPGEPGVPTKYFPMAPPGWKPGDPVIPPSVSLRSLPKPPPGWKPGDPVILPKFGELPHPKPAEQQATSVTGCAPPEASETRGVPNVLPADSDQDDHSSSTTSSSGSSDDDDSSDDEEEEVDIV